MTKKERKKMISQRKVEMPKETYKNVEFTFYSPGAMNVHVAGDFNSWSTQSLLMNKGKNGIWKSTVKLLPGRYEYKLFADGAWVENLPDAETVSNPFGTQNFVIFVK